MHPRVCTQILRFTQDDTMGKDRMTNTEQDDIKSFVSKNLWESVQSAVNFQHYKDTKFKTESQVFWDIFFKKIQSRSRFFKT